MTLILTNKFYSVILIFALRVRYDNRVYLKNEKSLANGPITVAIRARFEYDSTTIRLRFGYNTLQHATRFFMRSHTRSYTRISGRRVLHVD